MNDTEFKTKFENLPSHHKAEMTIVMILLDAGRIKDRAQRLDLIKTIVHWYRADFCFDLLNDMAKKVMKENERTGIPHHVLTALALATTGDALLDKSKELAPKLANLVDLLKETFPDDSEHDSDRPEGRHESPPVSGA